MARPGWSGAVVFGIVSIPVRMFSAVRDHDIHFHQISRRDRRRIRYLKVAEGSAEPVPAADIVKGYQVGEGRYVVFEDDELEKLSARKSRAMEITSFVPLADIDPRYFEQPSYLLPGPESEKAYRLLVTALAETGRVGIAQVVLHNREHLVAIRALEGVLMLQTLRFADEIVDPADLDYKAGGGKADARELALARQLVESMDAAFAPEDHHDEFRDRLKAAIARKAHGKTMEVVEDEGPADEGKVINLMEALERSLARKKPAAAPAATGRGRGHDGRRRRRAG